MDQTEDYPSADALLASAVFGKQVEDFWTSELGHYLQMRIEAERSNALRELARADRHDANAVGLWQDHLAMVELLHTWVSEVIADGLQATRALSQEE